jgi:hypothetical protein
MKWSVALGFMERRALYEVGGPHSLTRFDRAFAPPPSSPPSDCFDRASLVRGTFPRATSSDLGKRAQCVAEWTGLFGFD